MRKSNAARARELDWREFVSPNVPNEGVVYPDGSARGYLVLRIRHAFEKVKARIVA
jgi:hypothetical protein